MQSIPLKINKNSNSDTNRKANTRAKENEKPASPKPKNKLVFWLLIIVAVIETGLIAFFILSESKTPFHSLIPDDSISTIYFNQSSLGSLVESLKNSGANWPPISLKTQAFSDFSNKNDLDIDELLGLLNDEMVLVLLPGTGQINPRWILMASLKSSAGETELALERTKKSLKQNFNLISETYRQIEIIQAKPLNQSSLGTYFAQPEKLIILGNDIQIIKGTIDKALKQPWSQI